MLAAVVSNLQSMPLHTHFWHLNSQPTFVHLCATQTRYFSNLMIKTEHSTAVTATCYFWIFFEISLMWPSLSKNKSSERGILIDGQADSIISTVKIFCLLGWLGPLEPSLLIGLIRAPLFPWKVKCKQKLFLYLCAFMYEGSSRKGNQSAGTASASDRREAHTIDHGQHRPLPMSVRVFFVEWNALWTKTKNCNVSKML